MMGKDKPRQRIVLVTLGQVEVELPVDKVNLAAGREDIVAIVYLTDH